MTDEFRPDPDRPELTGPENDALEAQAAAEAEAAGAAAAADTFEQAADGMLGAEPVTETPHDEFESKAEPEPASKTERLQKILAQAGVASRRHAEELITEGRVQVNGKVVTELGTKADPTRDHIRVDGKLLQGSERLRYFMLNKPKGYVTTVSDPEGRPTIMEFFSKLRERLYPVGRLDYLSEGLLLVTNDGELANKLTRAASGVEKTYLVKVSGRPSEEEIERLREGVGIDRGGPGSGRVQTSPAEIRELRPGKSGPGRGRPASRGTDNPWYEVTIIEGRNRELRKMFEEIGHHVEKIRRVGYGPLVLDLEPGKMRELEPGEVEDLRKAAEGKLRKPKTREPRRQTPHGKDLELRSHLGKPRRHDPRRDRNDRGQRTGGFPSRGRFDRNASSSSGGRGPDRRRFKPQDRTDRAPFGTPDRGRFRNAGEGAAGNRREEGFRGRDSRFGARPRRRDFGGRGEGQDRPERRSFPSKPAARDRNRSAGSEERRGPFRPDQRDRNAERFAKPGGRPPRFDRKRPERSDEPRSFERPRQDRPRFDKPRTEGRDKGPANKRSARPSPNPRSGGFRGAGPGGRAGKQGSVRSGEGSRGSGSGPRSGRPSGDRPGSGAGQGSRLASRPGSRPGSRPSSRSGSRPHSGPGSRSDSRPGRNPRGGRDRS